MGQYYKVVAKDGDGNDKTTVYDRTVAGERELAKLMEHAWWNNPFCVALCATMVDTPRRIAWVGDYSREELEKKGLEDLYETAWGEDGVGLAFTTFSMDSVKYLVNDDKKQYVDLVKYKETCEVDGWTIHPLPILTCVGNGQGGGDYSPDDKANEKYVGEWLLDWVYLTNRLPEGYEEICPVFKEDV